VSTFLQQTLARQQIAAQIAATEQGRVRRQFREARRAARASRRGERAASRSTDNAGQNWAHQIGYA